MALTLGTRRLSGRTAAFDIVVHRKKSTNILCTSGRKEGPEVAVWPALSCVSGLMYCWCTTGSAAGLLDLFQ